MDIWQLLFFLAMVAIVYGVAEICKILGRIEMELTEIKGEFKQQAIIAKLKSSDH